ncbi:MAG: DUF3592 domain-containing protein [Archangiaceae bacterium]|nr:DUF3592 domain-containing protein [Archangiaceae bacterium]
MLAGLAAVVVFFIVGALTAGMGVKHIVTRRRIRQWPKAKGTMLEAKLSSGESMSQDEDGEWESSSWFGIAVRFRYEVAGVSYVSTTLSPKPFQTNDAREADLRMKKYRAGSEVEVLYDAKDPKTAYLESPMSGGAIVLLILGSVFLVASLGTMAIMLASS